MTGDGTREIRVDYIARVEGEGALTLRYREGQIEDVELRIFEPPRFFEAFLPGRSCLEAPDLTARICGICPVAYQMSACRAVEDALGVVVTPEIAALRRLLYCGEWIESHVLHMVMLHAPDFVGVPDVTALARLHGAEVRDALRVKKTGNAIVALLGGREIHPINVRIGGFHKLPPREAFATLADDLEACRPAMERLVRWAATFTFPDYTTDVPLVALVGDHYPFLGDTIATTVGERFDVHDVEGHLVEEHVAHTTALQARLVGHGTYLTGPLARWNLNFGVLPPHLRALATEIGIAAPMRNPYKLILVRGIEVLYALDEAIHIDRTTRVDGPPCVEVTLRAGTGFGATEAPRGLLWHRYDVDAEGAITAARIVPPTSQNQAAIEHDLRSLAPAWVDLDDATTAARAEHAIRNHDPCISCATHFLTVRREFA